MRAAGAMVAALACCLVAGCVSIPQSSPVSAGRSVGVQDEPQHVTNDPAGPAQGESAVSITQGFFAAMLAYPQTMATARQYLTSSAAAHWDPTDHVVVYDTLSSAEDRTGVAVSAHALGRLDRRGTWSTVQPAKAQMTIQLRLVRVNGEWRIANPPPGLYVDSDYFESDYGDFSLYFFDPSQAVLAADPVYLVDDDTAATALVSDLMQGPTSALRGVVMTAAPKATKVDVAVSTSPSGLTEVPLSDDILALQPDDRQLFAAQLAWTLRQLPDIHTISISVDGTTLDIPGFGSVFGVDQFLGYDPAGLTGERRLFALSPKGLVAVSPDGLASVLPNATSAAAGARSAAIDTKGALAALVSGDGTSVGVYEIPAGTDSNRADWVTGATALLRPSWDFRGVLWAVDDGAGEARIYVATADGQRRVRAPGLDGSDIASFGISRDGVRFAAIVRDRSSTRLVIAVIHRGAHRDQVSLSAPRTVLTSGVTLSDLGQLAWVSPTAIVMLAKAEGGSRKPWQVAIDGSIATDVGEFLHARPLSLASGANVDAPIAVGAPGGQLFVQQSDLQWLQLGAGTPLRMPVYAG